MSVALSQRIDAVESFAADVAHEIKNPLTSLKSALESVERVEDPALKHQLLEVAAHDVRRIDRLVTEISEASRHRRRTQPDDVRAGRHGSTRAGAGGARDSRGVNGSNRIEVRIAVRPATRSGDPERLERVLENLLDNAVSFSPPDAPIEIDIQRGEHHVGIAISDHGPGIPEATREKVFERFNSLRRSRRGLRQPQRPRPRHRAHRSSRRTWRDLLPRTAPTASRRTAGRSICPAWDGPCGWTAFAPGNRVAIGGRRC
jgi:two-component system sensor histidine kinase ChvG